MCRRPKVPVHLWRRRPHCAAANRVGEQRVDAERCQSAGLCGPNINYTRRPTRACAHMGTRAAVAILKSACLRWKKASTPRSAKRTSFNLRGHTYIRRRSESLLLHIDNRCGVHTCVLELPRCGGPSMARRVLTRTACKCSVSRRVVGSHGSVSQCTVRAGTACAHMNLLSIPNAIVDQLKDSCRTLPQCLSDLVPPTWRQRASAMVGPC